MTTTDTTLGEIVAANPATAALLDRLGLDYCCHGDRTLEVACADAGLDPTAVMTDLDAVRREGDTTWTSLSPSDLADHIVATHHEYLHEELPLLDALAAKVETVHGERHPELIAVRALVAALRADIEPHLDKEEQVLFPAIRSLGAGEPVGPSMDEPLQEMDAEHEEVGDLLARLRSVTDGFAVPDDGCASYRSLYERLEALERDTHLHVHKENHALFPAARALMASRGASAR